MPTPPANDDRADPPSTGSKQPVASGGAGTKRPLPEAAARALAEAAARRGGRAHSTGEPAKLPDVNEIGGRGGPDPTRYGDWEVNGLASDF